MEKYRWLGSQVKTRWQECHHMSIPYLKKKMQSLISLLTVCFSYPDMKISTSHFQKACLFKQACLVPSLSKQPSWTSPWTSLEDFLSSVLPPLCSGINLIKSVWKLLWGFLSISMLGNWKIPMLVTVIGFVHWLCKFGKGLRKRIHLDCMLLETVVILGVNNLINLV